MRGRWEKMVEQVAIPYRDRSGATHVFLLNDHFVMKNDALKLLQRQHNRVVRMVKQQMEPWHLRHPLQTQDFDNGYKLACVDILRCLARLKEAR